MIICLQNFPNSFSNFCSESTVFGISLCETFEVSFEVDSLRRTFTSVRASGTRRAASGQQNVSRTG